MAKSYRHTYARICDPENIRAAIHAAAKGKRHKRSVQRALANEDDTIEKIRDILINHKSFIRNPRDGFEINDGLRAKKRIIVHPTFVEQIIDHALMQIIEPHFMRKFYRWSCGSIPGRGQESMMAYVMRKVRKNQDKAKYYAILDVKKCFDTIDTDALYNEIAKVERDPETLALIKYKLSCNKVRLPSGEIRGGGVTIGTYTSPWFANIAIDAADHCFKDEHGLFLLVRFMDDMLVIHGNKREMAKAIKSATEEIAKFGLKWKNPPIIRKWEYGDIGKIRFCGVQITRETMEVRDAVCLRARRKAAKIVKKAKNNERVTWYDASQLISYSGRFRSFESWNAFSKFVLRGRVKMFAMKARVSAHDKLKAKESKQCLPFVNGTTSQRQSKN